MFEDVVWLLEVPHNSLLFGSWGRYAYGSWTYFGLWRVPGQFAENRVHGGATLLALGGQGLRAPSLSATDEFLWLHGNRNLAPKRNRQKVLISLGHLNHIKSLSCVERPWCMQGEHYVHCAIQFRISGRHCCTCGTASASRLSSFVESWINGSQRPRHWRWDLLWWCDVIRLLAATWSNSQQLCAPSWAWPFVPYRWFGRMATAAAAGTWPHWSAGEGTWCKGGVTRIGICFEVIAFHGTSRECCCGC